MATTLKYRFAMRRWTAAEWVTNDEVLLNSEWAYATDTGKLKIGDGVHLYSALSYVSTTNIVEGTNLYFTGARVNAALVGGDGISITFAPLTGVSTITLVGLPLYLSDQGGNQLTDQAGDPLVSSQTTSLPVDWTNITHTPTTLAGYGITDAQTVGLPVKLPTYTLLTLPSATTWADSLVVCTNLTEGRRVVYSDGTNWRRLTDNSIAS